MMRDMDQDGWLDIVIANNRNTSGDPGRSKIYMNVHPDGVFSHFEERGIVLAGASFGGSCNHAVSMDFDNDGDFDVYFGNSPGPSQDALYFNNGSGQLQLMFDMVPSDSEYTLDTAGGDVNGDGKLDILRSNTFQDSIIYNDNGPGSTGVGDFDYEGSFQLISTSGSFEHAGRFIDVEGDGRLDIYKGNETGGTHDRILHNDGNDAAGVVIWSLLQESVLPEKVASTNSGKPTVADLNGDGRDDVFVGGQINVAPTILRNVTVPGDIRFLNWTPDSVDEGGVHGWHGAVADLIGDERPDIFFGAWEGEKLYQQIDTPVFLEAELGAAAIDEHGSPLAVLGVNGPGDVADSYMFADIQFGRRMSVVLQPAGDYLVEVLQDDVVIASIDRGARNIEEALEVGLGTGSAEVRVTMLAGGSGDADGDGDVDLADFARFQLCFTGPEHFFGPDCIHQDFDADGDVDLADFGLFTLAFGESIESGRYQLEVLVH
jgi:hypothetical protein